MKVKNHKISWSIKWNKRFSYIFFIFLDFLKIFYLFFPFFYLFFVLFSCNLVNNSIISSTLQWRRILNNFRIVGSSRRVWTEWSLDISTWKLLTTSDTRSRSFHVLCRQSSLLNTLNSKWELFIILQFIVSPKGQSIKENNVFLYFGNNFSVTLICICKNLVGSCILNWFSSNKIERVLCSKFAKLIVFYKHLWFNFYTANEQHKRMRIFSWNIEIE